MSITILDLNIVLNLCVFILNKFSYSGQTKSKIPRFFLEKWEKEFESIQRFIIDDLIGGYAFNVCRQLH